MQEIGNYSFFQFLYNIIDYASKNIDTLIIGKYLGASRLGYYDRAYRLTSTVNSLTYVITPVLHPVLSRHQEDKNIIFSVFKKITKLMSLIGIPLSVYLFFSGSEIIQLLYGPQWLFSIPIFKYLSLAIWAMMLLSSTQSFFQVLGKTNYLFLYGLYNLLTIFTAVFVGVFFFNSLLLVAELITIAYLTIFIFSYYLLVVVLFKRKCIKLLKTPKVGLDYWLFYFSI